MQTAVFVASSMSCLITVVALSVCLLAVTNAMLPTVCADKNSLENSICCPVTEDGVCGEDANYGSCATLNLPNYNKNTSDVRVNWPHFYTQICQCNGNYGGYDCSICKFGYYGHNCSLFQVLPRKPLREMSDRDWVEIRNIFRMTRVFDSGYSAILEESKPGNGSVPTIPLNMYEYIVWVHHYIAKDKFTAGHERDYSHNGPGFFTWHRVLILNVEWQIQDLLRRLGRPNYHTFRLPYWDWRYEMQKSPIGLPSEKLFTEDKLGTTINVGGYPRVKGLLFDNWNTLCWRQIGTICDPRVNYGPLQRCPFTETDPCSSDNPDWPTNHDLRHVLSLDSYDAPPYNMLSDHGFRGYIDANVTNDVEGCKAQRMCMCVPGGKTCDNYPPGFNISSVRAVNFKLHTSIHVIVGSGDMNYQLPDNMKGHLEDNAASTNDPLFFFHHSMVDCIFEEWLTRHPDAVFPVSPQVPDGHRRDDFARGFLPLFTHNDVFVQAENFGYTCELANV